MSTVAGCQYISGVNDLEVVDDASGGTGGTGGGSGGDGGTATGSGGGDGGNGGDGGTSGSGGTTASGGSGGSGGTTASGGSGGSTDCTLRPGWECNLIDNCGCDEQSENCGYDITVDAAVCDPVGSREPYSTCVDNLDCPIGHGCIGQVCKKYCETATDCGWDQAACLEVLDGDDVIEGFGFCSSECDLRDPFTASAGSHACGDGTTCYPVTDDDGRVTSTWCVLSEGDAEQGESCLGDNGERDFSACAPGYFCSSLSYSCQAWCEIDGTDCDAGQECIGFTPPAVVGDDEMGTCFGCETGDFECSVSPECGCDSGEACKIMDFTTGASQCIVAGSVAAWGACEYQEDCAAGAGGCVDGFCRPFCEAEGSQTCAAGECYQAYNGDTPIPGFFYCDVPCEPVLGAMEGATDRVNCGSTGVCLPAIEPPTSDSEGAFCVSSLGGLEGDSCVYQTDCANGYGCYDSQCTPWCRDNADCTAAFPYCELNFEPTRYAGVDDVVGLCVAGG